MEVGWHLDELAVGVDRPFEVRAAGGGAGVDDRVRRAAEDDARAAGSQHHRLGGMARTSMVRRSMATLPTQRPDPSFTIPATPSTRTCHLPVRLEAADLLVERVEQLLAGGGPGERRPVVEGAAEAAEVEEPFRGAVERHAHPVEQVDDARRA
jgi:hypothetical protein